MNKVILLFAVFCYVFILGCATNSSFYGDKRLLPSNAKQVLIVVDDKNDNSVFKGNDFLQKKIVDDVCQELQKKNIDTVSSLTGSYSEENITHVILLASQGVLTSQGYYSAAPTTMDTYRSGIDSSGNAYTYSVPTTTGGRGNTYTVREVQTMAILFKKMNDGSLQKVGIAYSHGDGMDFLERRFNMTATAQIFGYEKDLGTVYSKNFVAAATELFDFKNK